jgi:hypothetical protein
VTAVAAREQLTDKEEAILRSWLGNNAVTDIARAHRTDAGGIGRTIDRLCNFNRGLGRQVLDTGWYEPFAPTLPPPKTQPNQPPVPARLVSPPPPRPAVVDEEEAPTSCYCRTLPMPPCSWCENQPADETVVDEPEPEDESEPVAEPAPERKSTAVLEALAAPEPAPADEDDLPSELEEGDQTVEPAAGEEPLDELLARAATTGTRAVRDQVALIRRQIAELADMLRRVELEAEARAVVDQKERELEAAKERLRAVTGTPDPVKVRAWARANGVPCNPHGTPARHVIEQYRAALMRGGTDGD